MKVNIRRPLSSFVGSKPNRRLCFSPRAVSSVVAQLLLIAVVAGGGSVLLATQLGSISSFNDAFGSLLSTRQSQAQEAFTVDDVWFNVTSNAQNVHVSVFNFGKTQITVSTVLINNTVTTGTLQISPGARAWFTVPGFAWQAGKIYFIRVGTNQGSVYETFWKS